MNNGALFVAYGEPARVQCRIALNHLGRVHPDWDTVVISDKRLPCRAGVKPPMWIAHRDTGGGVRDIKLAMYDLSPFEYTVYFDADTRARYSMDAGWKMLADGWDVLMCPTAGQKERLFVHIDKLGDGYNPAEGERAATIDECGGVPILALQGGAMWFRKNERVKRFFDAWREEWERWKGQDQAALMRALRRAPVRMMLLSRDWNGGSLLGHYHAHARRPGLKGGINGC